MKRVLSSVFTLRPSSPRRLLFIGGGAGMAPILSLLRSLSETGNERPATYYYGARGRRDLCFTEELRDLERTLEECPAPRFLFCPLCLSASVAS